MMGPAALLCVLSLLEAAAGIALDDTTIRTAVAAWLSDSTAAEAAYGHISTWDTSAVTEMSNLFCGSSAYTNCNTAAASFNEDIGAWDTSGVTNMLGMFYDASAFNQDLSGWAVQSVADMEYMFMYASAFDQDIGGWALDSVTSMKKIFYWASAFDQDLGWCVDDDVSLSNAFYSTQCASTSCGVKQCLMSNSTIRTAVAAWFDDRSGAEATYGHISTWETGGVTDMSHLFCASCGISTSSFNEDIGAWDTSGVTDMIAMFARASAFNQDLGDWAVHRVTDMMGMFYEASSFDQDLGWCVADEVRLYEAFDGTPCASTSCGVVRCPTKKKEQIPVAIIAGVAAGAALLLAIGAFCFYRRRKASMMDKAHEPTRANPEPLKLSAPDEATPSKEEEAAIPVAPEGEEASTEQPPPPPTRRTEPEPAASKSEEMYNQIAAWYNAPENAALRATWGAYPEPDEFQTWPGFVAVTNAFLDREAG